MSSPTTPLPASAPSGEAVIEVSDLSRRFGAFRAVDGVTFEVRRGEIFGYLGANGAGKSTTIRMLTGLLAPTGGRASVAGHDIARDPEAVKASIGYMSQKFSLYFDLPVAENLRFFGGAYGLTGTDLRRRIDEALEQSDLREHRCETTGALPGGVRQRLALACALLHRPAIVFLDEPTAGVDPAVRRGFWKTIRDLSRSGVTVFVTTHYLDEAEYCHRIGLMAAGKLVALDTPAKLKATFVPDQVYVARGKNLERASSSIATRQGVSAVSPFGAGLHLRVARERWDGPKIAQTLEAGGATGVTVEPTEASLEDVFLTVMEEAARARPGSSETP